MTGQDPNHRPSLRGRLLRRFAEDGIGIAVRQDIDLLRAALRAFHMLDPPTDWLRRPATLVKIGRVWARGRNANAALYPKPLGPGRSEMFARLGLAA
ncbi:MAG: hypothetical protein JOZ27_08480 [Caulobacteraceae bacterium]|nr:hypothetical protein [Caulobacteraceae bacterium]